MFRFGKTAVMWLLLLSQAVPVSVRAKPNLLVLLPTEGGVLMVRVWCTVVLQILCYFPFVFKSVKNYTGRVSRCCFLTDVRCEMPCSRSCQFVEKRCDEGASGWKVPSRAPPQLFSQRFLWHDWKSQTLWSHVSLLMITRQHTTVTRGSPAIFMTDNKNSRPGGIS